jgi:mannose-6-phosphate isomerase-like protein (cupin superfamily)
MVKTTARRIDKPWGHEEIFAETPAYLGKILVIHAGEALSLQYHERKEETLRVLEGSMRLVHGTEIQRLSETDVGPGEVFHLPPRTIHRMIAIEDCTLLEVSTAEVDDVVRLEDRYGREGTSAP